MVNSKKLNVFVVLSVLIVSAALGVLIFSSCSNLFAWYMPDDSDIFLTIGKYWANGQCIPYIDLFDHKGPIIFLLNAIGYLIGNGNKYGVAIVEIIFLVVSEYFAYKILCFKLDKKFSLLLSFLMPIFFVYNYIPGNYTEEYMLPFLFISFYLYMKWQCSSNNEHNIFYALFYGISFGFALMTRVTNALSICMIVLIIVIQLIINKKWKNLFVNALLFICGFCVVTIPFCIYFASKNALYDMWYATLLYNFDYTSNSSLTFEYTLKDIILLIRMTFAGVLAIAICLYNSLVNKNKRSLLWLFIVVPSTAFMFTLDRFPNYSLLLLPFLYISFVEISYVFDSEKNRKIAIVAIALLLLVSSIVKINKLNNLNSKSNCLLNREYKTLLEMIPEEDLKNNFIALDPPVDFYLEENIKPCCKYFIFQNWQSSNSETLAKLEINELKSNKNIHYLLVNGYEGIFKDVIFDDFIFINGINKYNLYKRIK